MGTCQCANVQFFSPCAPMGHTLAVRFCTAWTALSCPSADQVHCCLLRHCFLSLCTIPSAFPFSSSADDVSAAYLAGCHVQRKCNDKPLSLGHCPCLPHVLLLVVSSQPADCPILRTQACSNPHGLGCNCSQPLLAKCPRQLWPCFRYHACLAGAFAVTECIRDFR